MGGVGRDDVVTWASEVSGDDDAADRVAEGRVAYAVRLDFDQNALVRKRTGEYWIYTGDPELYRARTDRGLFRALRAVVFDVSEPTGVLAAAGHQGGLTRDQLTAWLDVAWADITPGRDLFVDDIRDHGWGFLVIKGPIMQGCAPGHVGNGTFAILKRTGEVWDLMDGDAALAAWQASSEAGFLRKVTALAGGPFTRVPF